MTGRDVDGDPPRTGWRRALLGALIAAGIVAFFALDGPHVLGLANLRAHREALAAFAGQHFVAALALGTLVYVAVVALSLPGAAVLSLAAGFVFGRWVGTLLVLVGATTGATLAFLAARYLFGEWAARRTGPAAARIREGFARDAFAYLLFLRLVPAFPFFLVNLAAALTPVPLRVYVLATAVGIVPGSFAYVNLGEALGGIDGLHGLVSPAVLVALALLGALALVPVVVRRLRRG